MAGANRVLDDYVNRCVLVADCADTLAMRFDSLGKIAGEQSFVGFSC